MIKIIVRQTEKERLDATREYCLGRIDLLIDYADFSIEKVIMEYLRFPFEVLIIKNISDLDAPSVVNIFSYENITAWIEEKHNIETLPKIDVLLLINRYPATDLVKQFNEIVCLK